MITDELILRSLKGETSEAEESELLVWRHERQANDECYRQIARLWALRGLLEPTLGVERVPTAGEILQRRARPKRAPRPVLLVSSRLRVAAALALLLGGAGALRYLAAPGEGGGAFGSVELITGANETLSARLADGSVVRLAPDSRLQAEITDTSRRARLNGRAYFAVVHDAQRPFSVLTSAGEVLVRGTRFDLEARSGELQLIVVDGAVSLASGGQSVQVQAGQLSRVYDGGQPQVVDVDDVYRKVDWIGNFVAFESTPLSEVVQELQRRYGLRVQVGDSALAAQTVTSWSANRSPREILAAICLALNASCTVTDTLTTIDYHLPP